jgi:ferredoxin
VSLRLRVNPIACEAHGLCAELFPERIRLDDWGYPIIDPSPIPAELEAHARRAVDACPTLALALSRDAGTRTRPPEQAGRARPAARSSVSRSAG